MSILLRRSLLVLGLLFGLLFAVGTTVLWHYNMPIWYALVFAVFVVGLQYILGPIIIGWIFKIRWVMPGEVSPRLSAFLLDACKEARIPEPKFGIIDDGNPNAFTYGRTPRDARVVVTQGLVDMLSEDELNAVVGHELGHIKHWDFLVMAVASLVPLILYIIYINTRNRRDQLWFIAIGAYAAYIVSQYIVLMLSRVREYYADYHAVKSAKNPNALATALVAIAYGLAKAKPEPETEAEDGKKKKKESFKPGAALSSLGFFNAKGASQFAMTSSDVSGNFSMENMRKAMRWDLHNPWAKWFELNSTHPLTAKRIIDVQKMAGTSYEMQLHHAGEPLTDYRMKFAVDLLMAMLPYLGLIVGFTLPMLITNTSPKSLGGLQPNMTMIGSALLFTGIGWFIRTIFAYRSDFKQSDVVSLVSETDVSHVRPIPATLSGKIIGRGMPGIAWSDDLVLQDENGFITMLYRQPLYFLEFLFGWMKAEKLVGRNAVVHGWYRRGPSPYFEIKEAVFDDGTVVKCYYYHYLLAVPAFLAVAGALILLINLF
ncbi:MAG: zinc metalloprotease HtpX [Armatimonadota bacterium]